MGVNRKAGELTKLESAILDAARRLGTDFHGFQIAEEVARETGQPRLIGYGTLYRALGRLVDMGFLTRRWETLAEGDTRPRRRYYQLKAAKE